MEPIEMSNIISPIYFDPLFSETQVQVYINFSEVIPKPLACNFAISKSYKRQSNYFAKSVKIATELPPLSLFFPPFFNKHY